MPSWVGAVVPKRWARRAVTRNADQTPDLHRERRSAEAALPRAAHVVRLRAPFDRKRNSSSATSDALKARRARRTAAAARREPRTAARMIRSALLIGAGARLPPAAEPVARPAPAASSRPARSMRIDALEQHGAAAGQLSHAAPHRPLPSLVRRAATIRCPPQGSAPDLADRDRCSPFSLPTTRSLLHDRYPPHHPVGDLLASRCCCSGTNGRSQRPQADLPSAAQDGRAGQSAGRAGPHRPAARRLRLAARRRAPVPRARRRVRRRRDGRRSRPTSSRRRSTAKVARCPTRTAQVRRPDQRRRHWWNGRVA